MYDYNHKPELNITPLVDVMLVLLAILMVTAPVIEYEEPISLPKGSKSKQVSQIKNINIILTKDMIVRVNKNRYRYKNIKSNTAPAFYDFIFFFIFQTWHFPHEWLY